MSHPENDPDDTHPDENSRWKAFRRWLKANGQTVWQEFCNAATVATAIYEAVRPGQ